MVRVSFRPLPRPTENPALYALRLRVTGPPFALLPDELALPLASFSGLFSPPAMLSTVGTSILAMSMVALRAVLLLFLPPLPAFLYVAA